MSKINNSIFKEVSFFDRSEGPANSWTDTIILYSKASYMSWGGFFCPCSCGYLSICLIICIPFLYNKLAIYVSHLFRWKVITVINDSSLLLFMSGQLFLWLSIYTIYLTISLSFYITILAIYVSHLFGWKVITVITDSSLLLFLSGQLFLPRLFLSPSLLLLFSLSPLLFTLLSFLFFLS